jgi:hypothetical protein
MLREPTLEHQQIYEYKIHLAKPALAVDGLPTNVTERMKAYLFSVFAEDTRRGTFLVAAALETRFGLLASAYQQRRAIGAHRPAYRY